MLHRDVGASQLGHRVVAVPYEDPLVELLGAPHRDHVLTGERRAREALEA